MAQTKKTAKSNILFLFLLILLALLALFFYFKSNKGGDQTPAISLQQEQQKLQDKVVALEKKSAPADGATTPTSTVPPAIEEEAVDDATLAPPPEAAPPADPCQEAANRIDQFFTGLDGQQYITDLQLGADTKTYFSQIITTLFATPPKVVRETDNLLSILQNAAHLFRVLGAKNMFNLKKIMAHEKTSYESLLADFHTLIDPRRNCRHIDYVIKLPLPELYTYSVYFLNTLGGQAYLSRREITLRTLVKYYCILILDQANEQGVNHLGLDIRYPITSLMDEMNAVNGLIEKDRYLGELRTLQEKYEKKHGKL